MFYSLQTTHLISSTCIKMPVSKMNGASSQLSILNESRNVCLLDKTGSSVLTVVE